MPFSSACPGDDATPPEAREAAAAMRAYLTEQIGCRRSHDCDDVLGALLSAHDKDGVPSFEELIGTSMLLFEAGNSTTASLIGNGLLVLAAHPVQRAWLAEHVDEVAPAVEELLRYESPVQNMGRTATRIVSLHGVEIPAGSRVLLLIGAANRDPRVWSQPDELRVGAKTQTRSCIWRGDPSLHRGRPGPARNVDRPENVPRTFSYVRGPGVRTLS